MLKNALTVAALCGALPAFAANELVTDARFDGAGLVSAIDDTFPGGGMPRVADGLPMTLAGKTVNPASPANATPDALWTAWTGSFIGSGKPTSLLFTATDTDDSDGTSLDDLDVIAVPEPGPTAMLAAGLLGLLGLGVRRHRGR